MKVILILDIVLFVSIFGLGIYDLATDNVTAFGYACIWIMLLTKIISEILRCIRDLKKEAINERNT